MSQSAQSSIATIESFLETVKTAEAHTEAGSIGGATTHPVKNVDDRTEPAKEGARSAENTADVKKDQGSLSVDSTPEAKAKSAAANKPRTAVDILAGFAKKAEGAVSSPGSASEDQLQIGTNKQPTGEDPSNETGSAKGGKDDPGSSHPARTDNTALDGHKYAFDQNTPLSKMASAFKEVGENLCAQLANIDKTAADVPGATAPARQTAQGVKSAFDDPRLAQQAGWELAGLLNGSGDKQAADRVVHNTMTEIIKTASADADRVARYYAQKQAGEGDPSADPSQPGSPAGGDPGAEAGGDPMGGDGGGGDPSGMLAAMGGGAGAGGPPPGGGGDPSGGMGGAGGGGDAAAQLAQILESLGVTPEELEQAMAAEQAGMANAGGGMPPGMGAPPPGGGAGGPPPGMGAPPPGGGAGGPPPDAMGGGDPMAKAAGAKVPTKMAADEVRSYITEVIKRSRR